MTQLEQTKAQKLVGQIEGILKLEKGSIKENEFFVADNSFLQQDGELTELSIHNTPITSTQLSKITEVLINCPKLAELKLMSCQLTNISPIKSLTQLQDLDLRDNNIDNLQPLYNLTNLKYLSLAANPITATELGHLLNNLNLETLVAWKLGLKSCDFLLKANSLKKVYLQENKIADISALLSLPKLKVADLRYSLIDTLPAKVAAKDWHVSLDGNGYKYESYIELEGNPITTPPIEIVKQGKAAIADYYHQLIQSDATKNGTVGANARLPDRLFEAKMLVVGEPGAGKTSLVRKLESPTAQLPTDGETTKGIDVLRYDFTMHQQDFCHLDCAGDIDGENFRVNLWDFGGQEIYLATHRFFLSKRALYAVVSDSRKEDTDFNYWLHIVEMFGGNSPVVIILNERDNREHQQDYSALKAHFGNIVDIKTVDLADDDHTRLEQVRQVVRHRIAQLEHIGSKLPTTWLDVRRALEQNPNNTMTPQDYLAICKQCGIDDRKRALSLSEYFHDIGVFLHFQDDQVLKNIIFLKPNWATNAIYQVLDDNVVFDNKGLLSKQDIIDIWQGHNQDQELERFCDEFLQLMIKFHLALKIHSSEKYIVPAKLPGEAPNYDWPQHNNLNFRYQFDEFMPKGILYHLMVELQHLIESHNNLWMRGMIISKNGATAEVIETYLSKGIHIRVSGENQRDLLIVIMDKLDAIISQFNKLKVKKLVPCHCHECKPSQEPYFYNYEDLIRGKQKGVKEIPCMKSFEQLEIDALLNAVMDKDKIAEGAMRERFDGRFELERGEYIRAHKPAITRDQIFISYSHKDKAVFDKVKVLIQAEHNLGSQLKVWEDTQIKPGEKWFDEIKENLAKAKVAILLISTDFLASKFIKEQELPDIIGAMQNEGATIVSLIVRPCRVTKHKVLGAIQCVNSLDTALSGLTEHQQEEMLVKLIEAVEDAMDN